MQANNIYLATSPTEAKNFNTEQLRNRFLIEAIFISDQITSYYTTYDRYLVGGAKPEAKSLSLKSINELRADYFLEPGNWVSLMLVKLVLLL